MLKQTPCTHLECLGRPSVVADISVRVPPHCTLLGALLAHDWLEGVQDTGRVVPVPRRILETLKQQTRADQFRDVAWWHTPDAMSPFLSMLHAAATSTNERQITRLVAALQLLLPLPADRDSFEPGVLYGGARVHSSRELLEKVSERSATTMLKTFAAQALGGRVAGRR